MGLIIFLVVLVVILLYIAGAYNGLVTLKNRVKNAWSQIDVQLKRRFDLIPNLVETVKGYAKHEEGTLTKVIEARNKYNAASTPTDKMAADGELSQVLNRLFALSEAYPDLKANTNFLKLQDDLKDTEDKISFSRQFYNDTAMMYNTKIAVFPTVFIANIFGFREEPYFKADDNEKQAPKVGF